MALSIVHLLFQTVVDLFGDGHFQASVQALGLAGLFQTLALGADVSAPTAELAGKVQPDIAVHAAHHTDHFPLGEPLPAAHTLPHRDLFLHMNYLHFEECRMQNS